MPFKSTVEILQTFVAFSEYKNFTLLPLLWLMIAGCGLAAI